jgi:asparagine synthase (glutamine-hydrolysing)
MCGLAGAIGRIDAAVAAAVERMSDALRHRGPDDSGTWSSLPVEPRARVLSGEPARAGLAAGSTLLAAPPAARAAPGESLGVLFAFRRLAIIDRSSDAHQPMIDETTGHVLVFNGEIYNAMELRCELEREGVRFRSRSDTEVLLRAYGRWGAAALGRLRGMFAFALYDHRQGGVLLARDRVGIKPLYVARVGDPGGRTVLFASELRALLDSGLLPRQLDPAAITSAVWNGFVIGPGTIIREIRLVDAGTTVMVHPGSAEWRVHRYWQAPRAGNDRGAVERLRYALETAARQHLVSDVPLGVFLSGGLDSSAVAALAARASWSDIRTYTLGFDDAAYDESPHARAVASAIGTRHTEVRLTQSTFLTQLPEALEAIDQPTFDAINTYCISRAVREAGLTVALAGTGGDELFGGYRSFADLPRAAAWARRLAWMPPWLAGLAESMAVRARFGGRGAIPPQARWGKLGDVLRTRGERLALYQTYAALFTRRFVNELIAAGEDGDTRLGLPRGRARELDTLVDGEPTLHAISQFELASFVGERLLRDTDASSMAVSLEVRVPLLDHEVIEAAAAVPEQERFQPLGRKELLRRLAMPTLDPDLFNRPKTGFTLPLEDWCRQALRQQVGETMGDADLCRSVGLRPEAVSRLWQAFQAGAPGVYWSRIWLVFILLWWCRRHRVSIRDG